MDHSPRNQPTAYEEVGEFVSIFLRDRVWQANYQFNGRQVRKSLKTRNKKEARRRALLIEKELLAGEHNHTRRSRSIEEAIDAYMTHLESEGRAVKTLNKYRFCFSLLLELTESQQIRRLDQLDVGMVDLFRQKRRQADFKQARKVATEKTIHNDTVTIRQLVTFGLKRGWIADDPLKDLSLQKPKRTHQPWWSRPQVESILAAASSPQREVLTLLADTGVRVGEAKWLTWDDVELERGLIHIRAKDGWRPKSRDARVIPIRQRLLGILSAMPRQGRWVFCAQVTTRHPQRGRQFSERRLLAYLKRLLTRLGLEGHLHTFRHSFISYAAIRGTPERVLRKWVGHVDREILDWYFHLADQESQQAMDRLDDEDPNCGGDG